MAVTAGCAVPSVPIAGPAVAEPARVRRLTHREGQKLQQIMRQHELGALAAGDDAARLGRRPDGCRCSPSLVRANEDTIRDVTHRGTRSTWPARPLHGRKGRPHARDDDFVIQRAAARPDRLGQPFTHCSLR